MGEVPLYSRTFEPTRHLRDREPLGPAGAPQGLGKAVPAFNVGGTVLETKEGPGRSTNPRLITTQHPNKACSGWLRGVVALPRSDRPSVPQLSPANG